MIGCGLPGAAGGGLAPDAPARESFVVHAGARFEGFAIGSTLGSEVHFFIADSGVTAQAYRLLWQRGDHAPPWDSVFARGGSARHVIALAAERVRDRHPAPGDFDASVLHASGAVPIALELVRLHQAGDCAVAVPVTELVYSFPQAALPAVPPARTTVVGLFRTPAALRVVTAPRAPDRDVARLVVDRVVQAALRATSRRGAAAAQPLAVRSTFDPELAADAAEVRPLSAARPGEARFAVAIRARYRESGGDTSFVSAVAITDVAGHRLSWVTQPRRSPLVGGQLRVGVRYVLRGVVQHPGAGRELLLVDRIDDVDLDAARRLVVDPWSRRVLAAQPLALRCR